MTAEAEAEAPAAVGGVLASADADATGPDLPHTILGLGRTDLDRRGSTATIGWRSWRTLGRSKSGTARERG